MRQKWFLTALGAVLLFSAVAFQSASPQQSEKFSYCHVSISAGLGKVRMSVDYGDGNSYMQIKGADGKQATFASPMQALNYMGEQGWELVEAYQIGQAIAGANEFVMKKRQ